MANVLVEIGLEEVPAHIVTPSMTQLADKTAAFLTAHALPYASIAAYSTPRRLAVYVTDLPEKQADTKEEVKGPAKKIALDENGNWSKAAQGFVRGQGLTTDDITFKEVKGVEYVYVTKETKGQETKAVLAGLKEVITSLTFPVTMHWANHDFAYIRPIHWIVALYDREVIPFEVLDVQTGRQSRGHRFLGETVSIDHADEYLSKLADQFVIADPEKRKNMIIDQIDTIAKDNDWRIDLDEDLLEEVNNLVEYPTAFVGDFEEKYLSIPEEILVTSMKEHQRYFDVRDADGRLLPHFISARNGNAVKIENVIKGNQKVLTARLEDAEFFYNEDKKLTIDQCVEKLKHVTFHEKIGSLYEKMQRTAVAAQIIGETVGLTTEELADLQRAAEIYKFDLVTNMVGEFPELQGIMGEKYALLQGEKPAVAQAIREHYMPISAEGALPESAVGAVLAIADKLDSLLSFFAVDMVPSGSNDPYALRRQSYGIIRILAEKRWYFPFAQIQEQIRGLVNADLTIYGIELASGQEQVTDFLKGRLRQFLLSKNTRHDVIEAVLGSRQGDISRLFEAAQLLRDHLNDTDFKPSMEALTRVINLAKKAELDEETIDPSLFENDAERDLYEAVTALEAQFAQQTMEENYQNLVALRPLIDTYFNQTMVMVEDETIRRNRFALLNKIAKMSLAVASLDALITK
ncbi:glycine-tRNA ligase, beta subunit [Enterococcus sp. 8G7_MSG3316]|uniref:Glycine--tRNA ligase beta subunit n=1 Tax=Candidatus Enterococcus testudinis TaxID=1834191 RepID=A0A242A5C8_9ENTE|nr:glycine--tRNA ligase subunit beta [Enterococcus sp. 8G7_MSG3316]OTN76162.1 glycine-tRNA ligase, beta subunit [Enterococcus sp. 8G7_MSG3316]